MKFDITFFPATYGDSIWIEYGDDATHHILIDGGTGATRHAIREKLNSIPENQRHFELIVVTHIDRDHIEGLVSLLKDDNVGFTVGDFWFNNYFHLDEKADLETLGAKQGETLSALIRRHNFPWNKAFGGNAVTLEDNHAPITIKLAGGMEITLLSPTRQKLRALEPDWIEELIKAGLFPGAEEMAENVEEAGAWEKLGASGIPDVDVLDESRFTEDRSPANGSSIAFFANFGGRTVLFAGDAHPDTILQSCSAISMEKIVIDLFKISHHGSTGNTGSALIEKFDCPGYVISTNGGRNHHPSQETIAWILKRGRKNPVLYFNYESADNRIWKHELLQKKYRFAAVYPPIGSQGLTIKLLE